MTYEQLKQELTEYWAKTPIHQEEHGMSLLQHTEQVLDQLGQLLNIYRHEINTIEGLSLTRILLYAALLHDLGKVHPVFQEQLRGISCFGLRHEVLSLAFLKYLDVPEQELGYLAAAVALHHKDWRRLIDGTVKSPTYFAPNISFHMIKPLFELTQGLKTEVTANLKELLRHAEQIIELFSGIHIEPYPIIDNGLSFEETIFKGLSAIDQLISRFESVGGRGRPAIINEQVIFQGILTRGFITSADHIASARVLPNNEGFGSVNELLFAIDRRKEQLWAHQEKVLESIGNQILIAPTGFGKTEAALLWAAKQREETGSRGRVYFLLPFRASMNAMADRFKKYFGETSIALVHAKSLCKAYEELIDTNYEKNKALVEAKIRESLARLNSKPYRICSPYQLIRSFFGIKGNEAILCSALGSQLIFDEIHAYEPDITGMTLATTQYLCNTMKARVLFMSATIPTHLLTLLQKLFPDLSSLITCSNEDLGKITRHKIELVNDHIFSDNAIQKIVSSAKDNSVLVVVNQVSRAIRLYDTLIQKGLKDVTLLHSRFNNRDRSQKERLLEPEKGKVLIATQVVEVSLDIDYDIGFFEIAPLEALLQRFGRVNRKGRHFFSSVIVFEKFESDNLKEALPYDHEHLEQVKIVLQQYISQYPDGHIRENFIQELLDASYPQSLKDRLTDELNNRVEEFRRFFIKEFRPFGIKDQTSIKILREKWDELFDGYEVLPECLLNEAQRMATPFDVMQLLVTISGKHFYRLKNEEKIYWNKESDQFIVKCNYDNDKGLLLK